MIIQHALPKKPNTIPLIWLSLLLFIAALPSGSLLLTFHPRTIMVAAAKPKPPAPMPHGWCTCYTCHCK